MKLVTAVVRPFRLEAVEAALEAAGVQGLTVSEVLGYGGAAPYPSDDVAATSRLRVEALVDDADADAERVVEALALAAHSEQAGDGRVWSSPLSDLVRVRTGERGAEAL